MKLFIRGEFDFRFVVLNLGFIEQFSRPPGVGFVAFG